MKPRLLSSKKWTPFPKDYIHQIEQAFAQAFPEQSKEAKLIVEGRIFPEEIMLRVGLLNKGRLQQNNFEVSVSYSQAKQDAVAGIHSCIDAAASLMNEFIEKEGEVDFPRTWKDYDFDGTSIWVQYSTVNTELESEADRLLGLDKEGLVLEEDVESEDLSKPSLFSGKSNAKKNKKEDMH